MKRFSTRDLPLAGLVLIESLEIADDRGSFTRLFEPEAMTALGWTGPVEQVNLSHTRHCGTIRGLHYQRPPHAEVKIVTCLSGAVYDVALDLRRNSPSFLHWHAVELHADRRTAVLIPAGCAHGFQTLTDDVDLLYLHSAPHRPDAEAGLQAFDERLGIEWPLELTQMSERDRAFALIGDDFEGLVP